MNRLPWLRPLFLLAADAVTLTACFGAAAWLRGLGAHPAYLFTALLPILLASGALFLIDGYSRRADMLSVDYTSQHVLALLAAMLGTLFTTFIIITDVFPLQSSRLVVLIAFSAATPLTLGYRRMLDLRKHRATRSIIFIGEPCDWNDFQEEFNRARMAHALVFCNLEEHAAAEPSSSMPLPSVLDEIMRGGIDVEAIILREGRYSLDSHTSEKLVHCYFAGTPCYTLELFHQIYWRKIPLYRLNQTWLFQEGFRMARNPAEEHIKRLFDIGCALLGLLLSGPVILLAALLIRLSDGAPAFFRQTRIGRNNRPFTLYKLRTMRNEPPGSAPGDRYTRENDPRVTFFGRFLRRSRIDELPQLFNVLRGEMSLIGPRAEWDRLVEEYEKAIPCYRFRHLVRPGITGWAQVCYPYGAGLEDARCKLEYDLYYIRHFSNHLDASIILKTIHTMLFAKGR